MSRCETGLAIQSHEPSQRPIGSQRPTEPEEATETEPAMYHFSRAIYRELAPHVLEDKPSCQQESNHELVLRACERAMGRLITDRRYFAKPARSLFSDVRIYFSLALQERIYMIIERNVEVAVRFLSQLPEYVLDASGVPRRCHAMTRKGRPCQRQPLPRSEYCPSHQHLTERLEELEDVDLAA